jgi:hypothetical protein
MKIALYRKLLALFVLLLICTTAADAQRRRRAAPTGSPATLTAMKILPYDRMSDIFNDDIANSQDERLNELDLSFLVKVEVSGKAGDYSNRNVVITAREGGKLIVNQNAMVGIFNENGKYYVAAWIYGPLCQPTTVEARLTGQRQPSTIRKTLKFQCGE